ncbi:MAG: PQQ-binding-like beta-propeller repeat protein, partial [Planctomycetota bacterium]
MWKALAPCTLLAAAAAGAPVLGSEDGGAEGSWTLFRGDRHLSGVAATRLPGDLELAWTYDAGKAITSSPVVSGGRVFFGSDDHALHCVDAATG